MDNKVKSIPLASWQGCVPPTNDSFFTVYCDNDYLYWGFHKSNGHFLKWRTAHISKISDDPIKELSLYFPDNSPAINYIFGPKNISFQSAMKKSKERSSVELFVFYLDGAPLGDDPATANNNKDDQGKDGIMHDAVYEKQIDLLSSIWSSIPCKQFRIRSKHFVESSPLLTTYQAKIKQNFGTIILSSFATATAHYDHPILTLTESSDGVISYIGSWVVPDNDEKEAHKAIAKGKPLLMTGKIPTTVKDKVMDELNKVVYRWKQNVIDCQPDIKCLAIVIADDPLYKLEGRLVQMLDEKEQSGLKDSGFHVTNLAFPILYGMNYLMDGFREKAAKAALIAKKKAEDEARLKFAEEQRKAKEEKEEKKRNKERLAKLAKLAEEAKKYNEAQGIEKELSRKRKLSEKSLSNNNDADGIEKTSSKKAKKDKGRSYIGRKVAKEFEDGVIYFGKVTEFIDENEPFWNIRYEDGDGEDMDQEELNHAISFQEKVSKQNKKRGSSKFKVFTPQKK